VEKDYENIDDIDDLSDNELRALVKDTFDQQLFFDPEDIEISVHNHVVTLSGRLGTEEELRVAERVVSDIVGIEKVKNNILVDPIRRAESPEAIDEHLVDEELHEDLRSELFGTTDVTEAIEGGIPWNPPDGPTPEGLSGSDASPNVMNDDH